MTIYLKDSDRGPIPSALATNLLKSARWSSKRRGDMYSLSHRWLQDTYVKQAGLCAGTGEPMSLVTKSPRAVSIDRINSSLGHTPDNCQLVMWLFNRVKGNLSEVSLLFLCDSICYTLKRKLTIEEVRNDDISF